MDIKTLPENERVIYDRLKGHYSLTFDRLKAGERFVRLLKVADIEEFLDGKDPLKDVSEFPFWVRLWDAAMILAYILGAQKDVQGKRLLEIGAGLGAPGLAAASAGFDVTLSDYEDIILDFQRVSAAASGLDNVIFRNIDWFDPPELEPFDVLAGAEIIYREDFLEPMLALFDKYLAADGVIFLAHDERRQNLGKFLELASHFYDIALKKQSISRDGKKITIIVNRLRKKNNPV